MPDDQPEWIRLACQRQGVRIREAREHANLTQEKLAERAQMSRSTIQRVEAGEGIKLTHLLLIARALEMRLVDLAG
ncbi:helix-turn-helix transcriptional regulator [Streptomyces sp. NPDC101455]|uniref:helix-turn-helix transcriptional regulator n=1 Tax=Streptomyces sp. NPDC101455 TaxID=3366142 RepID=UPI0038080DB3